jgi:hypothetical protein
VPSTGELLYGADKGGNEIAHIYLIQKNGEHRDLTPGENEKAGFGGWNEDRSQFYYSEVIKTFFNSKKKLRYL